MVEELPTNMSVGQSIGKTPDGALQSYSYDILPPLRHLELVFGDSIV